MIVISDLNDSYLLTKDHCCMWQRSTHRNQIKSTALIAAVDSKRYSMIRSLNLTGNNMTIRKQQGNIAGSRCIGCVGGCIEMHRSSYEGSDAAIRSSGHLRFDSRQWYALTLYHWNKHTSHTIARHQQVLYIGIRRTRPHQAHLDVGRHSQ